MENKLYPKSYNPWAGNPEGVKPDFNRCCESVTPSRMGGWTSHQCGRKRGFGPDKAYCKQHDPEAVAARISASKAKWDAATAKKRYEWHGKKFFDVLKQIADGHNDARGLAQEIVFEFEKGIPCVIPPKPNQ